MGIGFAIPVNLAKQVMESIVGNGSVTRGWIGVEPQNLNKDLLESLGLPSGTRGVLIAGVLEGGAAGKAGITPGDIITAVGNQSIKDVKDLLNQVAQLSPGTTVIMKILRKGKEVEILVQIAKRPQAKKVR